HHVKERPVLGDAVVEEVNRVARAQGGEGLRFTAEALLSNLADADAIFLANELDGRLARQQTVLCPPDLAHTARAQLLDQAVAAELACFLARAPSGIAGLRSFTANAHDEPSEAGGQKRGQEQRDAGQHVAALAV